ncbi:MAG TPA: hypothetical protein VK843_16730 [Planctomycetota bacterium]|nr:hypothetical protein [Planctomycetota bacterium]
MISLLLSCLFPVPCPVPARAEAFVFQTPDAAEVDAKISAAGKDVARLLELASSFTTAGQDAAAKKVFKKVLEIDAANETAHKGLNHQLYDKKWFESFAELAKYKREEASKMKGKGLARVKDEWVPEADAPFLRMGWQKNDKGVWSDPIELAEQKQITEWKAAGYQYRADDNTWIAPADFEKWRALLCKCGNEWLDTAKANEYHANIVQPWELMGEHFMAWSTTEWPTADLARKQADKIYPELVRIFGVEPTKKPHFYVLNSLAQYNQAAGSQPILIESEGISSLHGAYFADAFFAGNAPPQYLGCGVSYWDRKDPKLDNWGPYWLRWAAAQSFVEAIDPSWNAISDWIEAGGRGDLAAYAGPFWGEKKIPRWLRYGAASYVERYLKDPAATASSDPWALRSFAFAELKKGSLHKLEDVFAFKLDLKDIEGSARLYEEAGLVVSYLLDGAAGEKDLTAKHEAFKTALKSGTKAEAIAAADALQKSLAKHERDIKKFAGL